MSSTVKIVDTPEYINWDAAQINGKTHTLTTKEILYGVFGKPDSIITPNPNDDCGASYFQTSFKYVYIKGSAFELHGDSIVVSTLNFKSTGLTLVINGLVLSGNTTLVSLSKVFPHAVEKQYQTSGGDNQPQQTIILGTDKTFVNDDTDNVWILSFEKGKLVKIDHHYDC